MNRLGDQRTSNLRDESLIDIAGSGAFLKFTLLSADFVHMCRRTLFTPFNVVWIGGQVENITGYTPEEIQATGCWIHFTHPGDRPRVASHLESIMPGDSGVLEFRLVHKNGETRHVSENYMCEAGAVSGELLLYGSIKDVTDSTQARDALAASEAKYRRLHESLMDGYVLSAMDGRILECNGVFQEMLGLGGADPRELTQEDITPDKWHASDARIRDEQVLSHGYSEVYIKEYKRKDGSVFPVELRTFLLRDSRGNNTGMWSIVRDVSDRQRMSERMVQTEKMMSVGGLAAGMAHEINNPLSGILQNIQLIKSRLTSASPANLEAAAETGCGFQALQAYLARRDIPMALESIREAGTKAAQIVTSMLDFSRKSDQFGLACVNDLIRKAIALCRTDYDLKKKYDFRRIEITTGFADPMPPIPCNAVQIEQVFMNILQNAAQALAKGGEARPAPAIRVSTRIEQENVHIEIGDNGPGIEPAVLPHVFEPFFTTKEPGAGTGLGLSVSYFIVVNNHGGSLDVESRPGLGATFHIRLPLPRP